MLAVVWHSRTGTAQAMAQAAHAATAGRSVLVPADQAAPDLFLQADGYLFACPENLATMSGAMKEMFDRCYYPLLGRIEGRPYATMIAAGSDGHGAQAQIDRIATGWRLRRVADPLIVCTHAQTPEEILAMKVVAPDQLDRCAQLGAALAEGISLGLF